MSDMSDYLKGLLTGKRYLTVNGASKHLNTDIEYNEDNPGLGLTFEDGNKLLTLGGYKNSFSDPSYYLGLGYKKRFGNDFFIEPGILG
jgi:outer membrane receptor for Fe3+-dicitrate